MGRIRIYTNKTCPYCKTIKEELEKKDIEFINMDTTEHKVAWEDIVNRDTKRTNGRMWR